ncbi:MAG: hypothetical protein ABIY70_07380 [Capsulimonas sp.]|uniref:hypothetical protein n=1 Tax=Capsulimonas sp. TaxID=2494211 RepID=UPI00326411A3
MQISNSTDISKHETGVRLPIRQWYCDALSVLRRMMLVETGPPRQRSLNDVEYHSSSARRSAKRRRPAPSTCASQPDAAGSQYEQIQNFAMATMISQMQSLTQKIEAAAQRVEEVSDKAEAAEQTALKMAELTALAAAELAAFAATDQAKIVGFRRGMRRRSYDYSHNMDA